MTTDDDLERTLREARVETTTETDERILSAAGRALRRRPVRRWLPVAVAATVLALAGGVAATLLSRAPEPVDIDLIVAQTLPTHGQGGSPGLDDADLTYAPVPEGPISQKYSDQMDLTQQKLVGETYLLRHAVKYQAEELDIRGLVGSEGPLVNLDDVTAGLEDGGDTEAYDAVVENPFLDPRRVPLSTFSIDVDTASMSNVRRIIGEGRLPPKGAVRIEELVNYFDYDYRDPEGDAPFSVTTEVAQCPWNPGHRLVMVGLQGRRVEEEQLPPRNLVFLLDVSGSMDSPDKLPLVKAAMRLLVERLTERDHVGLVVYAGSSGVVLEPTPGDRHQEILDAIDRLGAGGSTAGAQGIRAAYELARRHFEKGAVNRVILATDGDFNVGLTSRSDLTALIEEERKSGVFLTVLGVGTGNLKDSQMEMLADKGNGNYAYLDSLAEARKVLVEEAGGTLVTIAKDVKVQLEFNPARVGAYRLVGYENRLLRARDFNDDTKDAGEIGAGHSVTALYEITPPGERPEETDPLKYQEPSAPAGAAFGNEVLTVKLRYKEPDGETSRLIEHAVADPGNAGYGAASDDFRFAAAVAAFGLLLRDSEFKGEATFALVGSLGHGALGEDEGGRRRDFLGLVQAAAKLAKGE